MNKPLYHFFANDHRRIDELLDKATADPTSVKEEYYHQFRTGLLKHIKMEEKILFPAAQKANGNVPLPLAARLRLDHGALTSLMVVPPTPDVIKVLYHVLEKHDLLEEEPGGMYDVCEKLTQGETAEILKQLGDVTEVPVHPYNTAEYALDVAKRTLLRAGFNFDSIVANSV
ncbi:MAG: hemerythrin domain-containing protein [Ginsengibacter sp.]